MTKTAAWLAALAVLLAGILAVQVQQYRALKEVALSMADVPANSLQTSWRSGGETVTVKTKRGVGETDAAFLVRHTKEVVANLETHPIDT